MKTGFFAITYKNGRTDGRGQNFHENSLDGLFLETLSGCGKARDLITAREHLEIVLHTELDFNVV